jgi:hypothetical protein
MLHKSQNDLIRDISTIPQGTIETPYSQNERVRNAQLATHQSLTSLIAPPKVWYLTSAGIAAYYQNF